MIKEIWEKICGIGRRIKEKWKEIIATILVGGGSYYLASVTNPPTQEQIIQEIEVKQEQYFEQHGRYWQGLSTKDLTKKPHYQDEGWNEFIDNKYLKNLPFEMIINTYKAPNGEYGYWIVLENEQFIKSIGYGIEAEHHTWEITKTATTTQ